ncbi:MAG: glycosyltransferase family 2 protein [Deltaproteobacteria bacterium]|nr:glycosyltransferase family 2 protein [Deltaproteobacteria bacterium]
MDKNVKYVIITPVRNEEEYIGKTIESVISQSITPIEWVIINDGSTDDTGKIIDKYANEYEWIKTIHRHDRGFRKSGEGVIEAFYGGYNDIKTNNYDFIVKLDGDLSFNSDYFERCFDQFRSTPKLGIGGGAISSVIDGIEKTEVAHPVFHVRGATKIYKKDCWAAIGGIVKTTGWDTMDEVKANMMGWETRSFSDLKITQLKATGFADGTWKNWTKNGMANYICGYHPLFMIFKCIKRILQKPYFLGSIALFYGFVGGYIKKVPQVKDKELIRYLRQQQLNKLFFRQSIWQ